MRDATHARKDPSFWVLVLTALRENGLAMGLTFALTWLRIQYDGKETKPLRQLIEAALGALIVMVVGLTVKEFGFSIAWSFATAGFIGVLLSRPASSAGAGLNERQTRSKLFKGLHEVCHAGISRFCLLDARLSISAATHALQLLQIHIKHLLLRPFPATGFAIDLDLRQVLDAVVIRDDLGIVGNVQRFAVLVFADGLRVGQCLWSQCAQAGGPIVIAALRDFFLGAGQHFLALIAAGPVNRVHRHAFVFIAGVCFDHRN
jgi:lambda family phage holin